MSGPLRFRLSRNVLSTISPPIPTAYEWAARYKPTPDRPLLDMSQGVPGIPPPQALREAIARASESPESFGYVRWDGEPGLRSALAEEMKLAYSHRGGEAADVDVTPDDIALTAGCNMAFVAVAMTLADAGDEVILPVPWYFNHQMDLNLLGIKTVGLPTLPEDGFLPSVEKCKSLITPKTKAIALVTPNNPTGAIYPPSLIHSFAKLASEAGIALILDETYRDFVTTGEPPHGLFSASFQHPPWRSTLIQVYSFSKSYCLPGHRLGAIVASPSVLSSTKTVLDCLQICAPRPVQIALSTLLPTGHLRPFVEENKEKIAKRHRLFREILPSGWGVGAQGGYFAFVRHPFGSAVGSEEVCRRLAEEVGVVTLPASFFTRARRESESECGLDLGESGADVVEGEADRETNGVDESQYEGWIRFSVANVDDEKVRRVCERLAEFDPSRRA